MIYILGRPAKPTTSNSRSIPGDNLSLHRETITAAALPVSLILALLLVFGFTVIQDSDEAADRPPRPTPFGNAVLLGHLESSDIKEASGMVASRRQPGVLWILNDGGNAPVLYAVGTRGAHLGRMRVRNAQNVDWEDLAAFRDDNTATLLIADFGDNRARRDSNDLYFVREPDISGQPERFDLTVDSYRRVRFVYEDGPRDCEGVAVDPVRNQILLMTKRSVPPVIYVLPLSGGEKPPPMVARRLAVAPHMRPPADAPPVADARFENLRSQPTAMDISPDGSEIAVLTYGDAYLYRRPADLDWSNAFQGIPDWIRMPTLRQAEALCFVADGHTLIVTSEKRPAPLYRLDRFSSFPPEAAP